MQGIILLILILIITSMLLCPSIKKPRCNCKLKNKDLISYHVKQDCASQRGLHEIEQTPLTRGFVPEQNQPDHVANMWKCDYSHPNLVEGAGCLDTVFASDFPTPLRGAAVNQNVEDVSNMHLISRFAVTKS